MKPLYLEFKGINSFSEKAEIDFSRLCEAGLFGIFGKTGSGKSTILDCILYALFSRTSRKQTLKEYLNNKSSDAYVRFVFEVLSNGERRTFKVNKTLKLNKRGLIDTSAELFELKENDTIPLCEGEKVNEKIKEIIGVSYDEFARCIILPQNEFAAFVKSSRAERLSSVSKLFGLEKYDFLLGKKLKEKISETQAELAGANGELKSYEIFTKEYLEEKRNLLNSEKARKTEINRQLSELESQIKKDGELYSDKKKYIKNEETLKELLQSQEKILNKKDALANVENARDVLKADKDLTDAKEQLSKLNHLSDELSTKVKETEQDLKTISDEQSKQASTELEKYISVQAVLNANISLVNKTEKLRIDYKEQTEFLSREKKLAEETEKQLNSLTLELQRCGSPEKEFIRLIENIGSLSVKEELISENDYFTEKLNSVKPYTETEFGKLVHGEIVRKIAEIKKRIDDIGFVNTDVSAVSEQIEIIKSKTEKANYINAKIAELTAKKAASLQKIQSISEKLTELSDEGIQCKKTLEEVECRTGYSISSNKKLSQAIEDVEKKISDIKQKAELVLKRKEAAENNLSLLREKLSVCEGKRAAFKERIVMFSDKLSELLDKSRFSSSEEAKAYALDENIVSLYNKKVSEYEARLNESLSLKSLLEKLFADNPFDETSYESLLDKRDELSENFKACSERFAVYSKEFSDAEENLKKSEKLREKRDEIASKMNLLIKLGEVLYGRNLLDFIAEEYLSEISFNASRTLLLLTSGRYDLIYDGDFFVSDNLSCGDRRPVSTLSGGETFLVSLSLALSLSQAICEKTNKPVEFFFLDEGFGTLDEDLTEVVLDSLDRLRSANFTIGLISHVIELKQRIQSKILVSPATATHGSTVETIC